MAGRGVLFAIDEDDASMLSEAASDDEVLELVEVIEERWEDQFVSETYKAWDAIHRCLTDGRLEFDNGVFPLNRCILGGTLLTSGDDYIVVLTEVDEVPLVAAAPGRHAGAHAACV